MARLHLEIVSPSQKLLSQECDSVTFSALEGEMGVFPEHAAWLGKLSAGIAKVQDGGQTKSLAVRGGFAQILDNQVTLLADEGVLPEQIQRAQVESRVKELEQKLNSAETPNTDRDAIFSELEWNRVILSTSA